jgi:hypothetical protein
MEVEEEINTLHGQICLETVRLFENVANRQFSARILCGSRLPVSGRHYSRTLSFPENMG